MAAALSSRAAGQAGARIAYAIVLVVFAFCVAVPTAASANPRYAGLVIDALSGEVFYEDNADRELYPASLTKMMTLYLTFQALEQGRLTLNQSLTVSAAANAQPPSRIEIATGASITVQEAIFALVTRSANNIAVVLAEGMAGSETAFAQVMTQQAQLLGMTQTVFRNASGLPHSGQHSSARDMARLAQALLQDYPQYYGYFSTQYWTYRGNTYHNHNRLLGVYPGMDGLKTGYIRASGFNLVASAVRGRLRLIAVVFGGQTASSRNEHMTDLLDRAFGSSRGQYLIVHGSVPFQPPLPERRPAGPMLVAALPVAASAAILPAPAAAAPAPAPVAPVTVAPVTVAPAPLGQPVPSHLLSVPAPPSLPSARQADRLMAAPAAQDLPQLGLASLIEASLIEASLEGPAPVVPGPPAPVVATPRPANGPPLPLAPQPQGSALNAPEPTPDGLWAIQIGAYNSPSDGQQALRAAAQRLPDLLRDATVSITEVETDQGQLFRARLVGLDQEAAAVACRQLDSSGTPCLAIAPGVAF